MPYGASFNGDQDFDVNGHIVNIALERRLKMLARDLVIYGKIIRDQFLSDIANDEVATFAARYRG
jgi:FMN reductase